MNVAAMLALQDIDSHIQQLANRRVRLPELTQLAEAQQAAKALRQQLANLTTQIETGADQIEQIEKASNDLTTKRARLEAQLKTIIAPREAEALMHEIEIINTKRGELDDQELTALEVQSEADDRSVALRLDQPAIQARVDAAAQALAGAQLQIDAETADFTDQRAALVDTLTPDEIAAYDQLSKQHHGQGIARLEGHRCSGCHLDLSAGEIDAIKATPSDQLGECPQCYRALVMVRHN